MQQYPGPYNAGAPEGPSRPRHRYRSLFWPVVLIAAGVIWLLFSLDVLEDDNARVLSVLWPILLVGIGLDLLLGRRSPVLGGLIAVVIIGLIVVLMVAGANAGWLQGGALQTRSFTTPVGQATSSRVEISTGPYSANVHALEPSIGADRPLLAATVSYRGSVHFEATEGAESRVTLEARSRGGWFWWWSDDRAASWDIGLDGDVPMALQFESGSGSSRLDLTDLTLSSLDVDMSSGDAEVALARAGEQAYETLIDISSGDLQVAVPDETRVNMSVDMSSGDSLVRVGRDVDGVVNFDGSSGGFTIELAAGQAYRVEVQRVSSGDVDLPSGLVQVSSGDDEEGVWETQGYAGASRRLVITIEISSGDVTVRQTG